MNKIDTSEWKPFEVGKLFDIHPTKAYKMNNAVLMDDGENPVVVNSSYNNGIGGYTSQAVTEEGNRITFSDTTTADAVFYQPKPFVGYPHVQGMYPIGDYADKWTETRLLFFVVAFKKAAVLMGFDYAYKFTREIASEMAVFLPIDSDGEPDWAYMDSFMQNVMNESKACLGNLRLAKASKSSVDISTWKNFEIGSLFDIVKGTRLTKANMKPGDIRFIGSSAMNNGWTTSIKNDEHLHPANTLTVCYNGSVGETFYQDAPFWASDDVNVLYPKFKMNERIGMFIAPLIRSVGQRYAFVDKWRMEVMEHGEIKLPVDKEGIPDWAYMDSFMSTVLKECESALTSIKEVG
ncbi:restriction endonuclease subunit S [Streptococcus anginosus]|uniref:restriction endonuclease subunit S n=1 Tax=Streptococcus TaxID=1301 RepID=UPI001627AF19|nr:MULTISPECIES: restriction endonuclease subunit S [Streptococcus]MCW0929172.1 restriction endonuclease subunit S [Streptococcus anginosus]MCW0951827.1 restriction endonuclease subunit S [Streptococcus anginosus]MCW0999396.1 restriction endonuclease subunit S [Streptococcus anginosus]MED5832358.1 restriction endonuclease subunit S [Streptococcus anginosus]QNG00707.1 type I restriction endonuclease subunit S [Streptococcus agalactiae]